MTARKGIQHRLMRIAAAAVTAVIALFAVLVLWHGLNPDSFFKVFGFRNYLIAYTGSMEPELKQNDLIVVQKCSFDSLAVGDIITFYGKTNDGQTIPITHRIEDIIYDKEDMRTYLRTRGSNLPYPDFIPVTEDGAEGTNVYIGKLAAKSRILGNAIAFTGSPQGLAAISVNAACLIGIAAVAARMRKRKA